MIRSGDVAPRRDTDQERYVAVLSNNIHLSADTGRVIVCPFIPGAVDLLPMVVDVGRPAGTVLPELVQWLPASALGEPIGHLQGDELSQAVAIVTALIS